MHPLTRRIAERIRQKREQFGYSQERLAERAGIHRTYIGAVERGEKNVTVVMLDRIARALGESISYLVEERPSA